MPPIAPPSGEAVRHFRTSWPTVEGTSSPSAELYDVDAASNPPCRHGSGAGTAVAPLGPALSTTAVLMMNATLTATAPPAMAGVERRGRPSRFVVMSPPDVPDAASRRGQARDTFARGVLGQQLRVHNGRVPFTRTWPSGHGRGRGLAAIGHPTEMTMEVMATVRSSHVLPLLSRRGFTRID
jgi:hypothetical protein